MTLPHAKVCAAFDLLCTLALEIVVEARTLNRNWTGRTLFVTFARALMSSITLPFALLKAIDHIVTFVILRIVALPLTRVATL